MSDFKKVSVVAALVERDGEIFLARRAPAKRQGGLWELPGGKVEPGEEAADALVREIREELSLDALVESVPYDDSVQDVEGVRFRFMVFRAAFPESPSTSTDHDKWDYFSPQVIPFGELAPLDTVVLRRWAKEASSPSRHCFGRVASS
jgi:8-oxo-dGTP diphosphatase